MAAIIAPAMAQEPQTSAQGAPAQGLGESDVIRLALLRPEARALNQARSDAAAARRRAATALPDPRLEVSREAARDFDRIDAEDSVFLSIPLDLSGAWIADRAAARAAFDAEQAVLSIGQAERAAQARALFHRLAAQTRMAETAAARAERLAEAARRAQARLAEGDASELEAARFRAEAANARSGAALAEAERAGLEAALQAALGISPDALFTFASEVQSPLPSLEAALTAAAASPQALSRERSAQAADFAARAAGRRAVLPAVALTGGVRAVDDGIDRETGIIGGLSVSLPLFGRARAQAQEARAEARRAELDGQLADARMRGSVSALWTRAVQLQAAVPRAGDGAAERRLLREAGLAALEGGEIDVAEWLDAERAAFDNEVAAAQLSLEAALARVALDEIIGTQEITP